MIVRELELDRGDGRTCPRTSSRHDDEALGVSHTNRYTQNNHLMIIVNLKFKLQPPKHSSFENTPSEFDSILEETTDADLHTFAYSTKIYVQQVTTRSAAVSP
jgi:hypothetical protein